MSIVLAEAGLQLESQEIYLIAKCQIVQLQIKFIRLLVTRIFAGLSLGSEVKSLKKFCICYSMQPKFLFLILITHCAARPLGARFTIVAQKIATLCNKIQCRQAQDKLYTKACIVLSIETQLWSAYSFEYRIVNSIFQLIFQRQNIQFLFSEKRNTYWQIFFVFLFYTFPSDQIFVTVK